MKLSVPHNGRSDLLDAIDLTQVDEIFGKLNADAFGGGRASVMQPFVSRGRFRREVRRVLGKGLRFNYLLNSSCPDGHGRPDQGEARLTSLLEYLEDLKVDTLTVSLPHLVSFIKKKFPRFCLHASTMAQVNTPDRAKFWEDRGVARITLDHPTVNRDLDLIRSIRKAVSCELQVIVNNACFWQCPFTRVHYMMCSHASQEHHELGCVNIEPYRSLCTCQKLLDPVHYVRADWIRPEDVGIYEGIGVGHIKLVDRGMTTAALARIVKAYTEGRYDGNLVDLLNSFSNNFLASGPSLFWRFRFFRRFDLLNVFKMFKFRDLFREDAVFIDNRKLDGFLAEVQAKRCRETSCAACGYCEDVARAVVDRRLSRRSLERIRALADELISGRFFSYR